jgi:putative inorganic carbon (hco3(-)) transporter
VNYFLFILINANLFIRPAEVVPELLGWPIYETLMICALVVNIQQMQTKLTWESLRKNPISFCVLAMLPAIVVSCLAPPRYDTWSARFYGLDFIKTGLYYFLAVTLLDSPERLKSFLRWLLVFTVVLAGLALLQYHEIVNIPALALLEEGEFDAATGEYYTIPRLVSTGIYNDPNDLSMILLMGIGICLYFLTDPAAGVLRPVWIAPIGVFLYAFVLTQSRGGMISLLAGLTVLFYARFGLRRTIPLALVAIPAIVLMVGGRQAGIGSAMEEDTGQARLQLWSEGLAALRQNPLFGVGYMKYAEEVGQVAHNSYVHCYVELGVIGGSLFFAAFLAPFWWFWRVHKAKAFIVDFELDRMRPYMHALVAAYAAGMLSLSRAHIVPTYMVLALATQFMTLAETDPEVQPLEVNGWHVQRTLVVSALFLIATYLFVRVFVNYGG